MGAADQQRVEGADLLEVFIGVGQLVEDVAHGVEARAFAVRLDHRPGASAVSVGRTWPPWPWCVVPLVEGGQVDGAELPLLERVGLAFLEASALFFAAHREPELDEVHAAAHQVALELGRLAHELEVFVGEQKPITRSTPARLYQERSNSAISPGGGQVLHVTLEIPLAALGVGGAFKGHHAGAAGVEVFHEALDGAALAGRVAAFEGITTRWPVSLTQAWSLRARPAGGISASRRPCGTSGSCRG